LPVCEDWVGESSLTPQLTQLSEITADSQQMVQEVQLPTTSAVTLDGRDGEGNRPFYVLLVDDEPINLQVLKNHFIGFNYHITTALSGEQALNHVSGEVRFDLVLLDVMMPKMSGYEVASKIRETHKAHELPIIMLTAKNQVADLVEGFSCGANDYLAKPFSKDELLARIKTQLNLVNINSASARFFPSEFLSMLSRDSIVDVRLGDQIQSEMTILFLDIRAFTLLSENMTPKENFDFLNEYLSYVIPSINDNKGFIDKYIGDAVMALFPVCADDAVKAAVAILRRVEQYNELRIERDQQTISIGIGLHTGNLMLGTIGNDQRMDGTVISDAVNLASRLEGLTKTYGTSLVISERCFEKLSPDHPFNHRSLGRVQVKGKDKVIGVIEIMDGESEQVLDAKKATLESFERGLKNYFDRDFEESARAFKQVLKLNPNDQTALMYHKRSATYMVNGVGAKWDGTERMDSK
ncbi:MAG: response regulator, partial [Psychrosphaera sp.]|nr:response regulator [Psychrosphaera sp.]